MSDCIDIRTLDRHWAGLHAGPVHVLVAQTLNRREIKMQSIINKYSMLVVCYHSYYLPLGKVT